MDSPEKLHALPIRLLTRCLSEMQTSILSSALRVFAGDLDRFAIYTLVMRATYPLGDETDGLRTINAHSLAHSLSQPYETVRRHLNHLVTDGFCERRHKGVAVSAATLRQPDVAALVTLAHDSFVRFVEDIQHGGMPLPDRSRTVAYRPIVSLGASADLMLAVADTNRQTHANWLELALFSTILCTNMRSITLSSELSRRYRYGNDAPSHALWHPVRASVISRTLSLPETTVRRHLLNLLADGRIIRTKAGLLVNEEWLNSQTALATSTNSYQRVRLILARAGMEGFPLHKPQDAYLAGRPAPISFA